MIESLLYSFIFPNLGYFFLLFVFIVKIVLIKAVFSLFKSKESLKEFYNKEKEEDNSNNNKIFFKGRTLKQSKYINYTELFKNKYEDESNLLKLEDKEDSYNNNSNNKNKILEENQKNSLYEFLQLANERHIIDDFFGLPHKSINNEFQVSLPPFASNNLTSNSNNDLIVFDVKLLEEEIQKINAEQVCNSNNDNANLFETDNLIAEPKVDLNGEKGSNITIRARNSGLFQETLLTQYINSKKNINNIHNNNYDKV